MSNLKHLMVPAIPTVRVVHVELESIIQGVLEQAGIESVLSGSGAEDDRD
jgi:hypothetical protein